MKRGSLRCRLDAGVFGCGKKVLMKKAGTRESKFNKIPADIYACSTPHNYLPICCWQYTHSGPAKTMA